MNRAHLLLCLTGTLSSLILPAANAQVVTYTDEGAFLDALVGMSSPVVHEGFEDDAAWGTVRSTVVGGPMTASSIHHLGLTWVRNNPASQITTGGGAAVTGNYGFFQNPHGDPASGFQDGMKAIADTPLVAIGGWIRTNTPAAGISLLLDGVEASFQGSTVLNGPYRFFGAVDPSGFMEFEFRETEAAPGDWKLIFADDFKFAFAGEIIDCNLNGIGDALDISSGTSDDCDLNGIPDDCEPDCNANGVLDACEVVDPVLYSSGNLGTIGFGVSRSFLIPSPVVPVADVVINFSAYANLSGPDEYLEVLLNGTPIGRVYEYDGEDCPDFAPTTTRLIVPESVFANLVGTGQAQFLLEASLEVDADDCDSPSQIAMEVTIFVPSPLDANADGTLDECEPGAWPSYCSGDGGNQMGCTDCACNNNASPGTVGGCLNTVGTSARLLPSGAASLSADTLRMELIGGSTNTFAILFSGDNRAPANAANPCFGMNSGILSPALDGLRCSVGGIQRHGTRATDGVGQIGGTNSGWGAPDGPPGGLIQQGAFAPGQTRHFQVIYRDDIQQGCMTGFNTSQAVSITFSM